MNFEFWQWWYRSSSASTPSVHRWRRKTRDRVWKTARRPTKTAWSDYTIRRRDTIRKPKNAATTIHPATMIFCNARESMPHVKAVAYLFLHSQSYSTIDRQWSFWSHAKGLKRMNEEDVWSVLHLKKDRLWSDKIRWNWRTKRLKKKKTRRRIGAIEDCPETTKTPDPMRLRMDRLPDEIRWRRQRRPTKNRIWRRPALIIRWNPIPIEKNTKYEERPSEVIDGNEVNVGSFG